MYLYYTERFFFCIHSCCQPFRHEKKRNKHGATVKALGSARSTCHENVASV